MRIIAGRWGGRRLAAVGKGDVGAHLRPTPDRVRESLFSMLAHRDVIDGARVLDLFAGTGALAFEALSRGAQSAVLIEKGRVGQRLISENIKLLGATEAQLKRMDATRLGPLGAEPFTLVFLDPPYGQALGRKALIAAHDQIAPGVVIVWEEKEIQVPPAGYAPLDQRRMGGSCITLLTRT